MPELPEVETTRRRLEPLVLGKRIVRVTIRVPKLRLPIPQELTELLPGRTLERLERRGKYLLFFCDKGCLVVHLGMTGFIRLLPQDARPEPHDHFDLLLSDGKVIRLHDPRRFGIVLWVDGDPYSHQLLAGIGPEPFSEAFNGAYLVSVARRRKTTVKQFIMDATVVAGIGNIYANEALFLAGIRPDRLVGSLDARECDLLAESVREVLTRSLAAGSSWRVMAETLGYYPVQFKVYGRSGKGCPVCGGVLEASRTGNRSTVFCPRCQH